jgi:hypothetical protein
VGVDLGDGLHDVAFDELAFATGAAAEGIVRDAIDVAKGGPKRPRAEWRWRRK